MLLDSPWERLSERKKAMKVEQKIHSYDVPFAYEMYGRITVKASSKEEAIKIAEERLSEMSTQEMAECAEYISDSDEPVRIDEEGVFYEDGVAIYGGEA